MEENQDEIKTQTENVSQPKKQKASISIKKLILIVGIILIVIVTLISGLFFIVGRGNNDYKNLSLIFDENKLIPVKDDNLYGYISPKNGKMVIKPSFISANPFYGNYACVSYSEDGSTKYGIIDKSGKIKLSTDSSSNIKILSEYGLFIVDDVLYNNKLKALTDENTTVSYENLGYTYYTKRNAFGKNIEAGIINPNGKKVYSYKFKDDESFFDCRIEEKSEALKESYAVINVENKKYAIINLSNGKVIYKFTENYIYAKDDNIFVITNNGNSSSKNTICIFNNKIAFETSDNVDISYYDYDKKILEIKDNSKDYSDRYSYYDLNKKAILNEKPEKVSKDVLSSLTGYYSFSVNGKYGIMKNGKQVLPNEFDDIEFLPVTTFNYLKDKKHVEYIFAKKDKEYQLINLKNKKVITSFYTNSITSSSTSTFIKCKLRDSSEYLVYNLATRKSAIFDSSNSVTIYSNYITVSNSGNLTYYNTDLKEIYNI